MTSLDPIFLFVLALGVAGVWGTQSCLDDLMDCRNRTTEDHGQTCKWLGNMIKCVSESRCRREETNGVTFRLVQKIASDSCPAFSPLMRGPGEDCNDFTKCLAKNATNKYLMLIVGGKNIINIRKTGFWCSLFEQIMTCAITNADECNLEASSIRALEQQRENARNVCPGTGGAGTIQQGTLTTALVVWTAALILPLIFA